MGRNLFHLYLVFIFSFKVNYSVEMGSMCQSPSLLCVPPTPCMVRLAPLPGTTGHKVIHTTGNLETPIHLIHIFWTAGENQFIPKWPKQPQCHPNHSHLFVCLLIYWGLGNMSVLISHYRHRLQGQFWMLHLLEGIFILAR